MLRALRLDENPSDRAYRVPWVVDRSDRRHPIALNASAERLEAVRVFVHAGRHDVHTDLWGSLEPNDEIDVCLCGTDVDDAIVTLAWFSSLDGREYLWRLVL